MTEDRVQLEFLTVTALLDLAHDHEVKQVLKDRQRVLAEKLLKPYEKAADAYPKGDY